jgi:hypothetical protein
LRSLVGDLVLVRLQEERDPLLHKRLYNALRRAILTVRWRRKAACRRRGIWRENSAYQETPY